MLLKIKSTTNRYKDDEVYTDIIKYITNPKKTRSGYIVGFNVEDVATAGLEMRELASSFNKLKGIRVRHMILSFDPKKEKDINADFAFYIGCMACRFYEDDYQMVLAVHEGRDHLHIHIVMNTVNMNTGKKHPGDKQDYYRFQRHLKSVLKFFGLHLVVHKDAEG